MFHLCDLIAMKFAFHNLKDSDHQMRNRTIKALIALEVLNLSVLLCSEEFIHKLNKDWRDEDRPTDVLSMSQNIPELELQILMVGDIVILVEPATRHVEERRCSSLDEINILLVGSTYF
ncbi:hypothetical protein EJD97_009419 [Solanum chilense]|uniref:Uncharacterized protein n=1 Tax=Solanum chilense TaxID=4083 RepID=A0A6N2AG55_SOLCI|nr:hypothetical protein EJD97_009419 [Solanum chilense]